nr:MAG TPA: hypothetical protein [Crassvirales sp.]
MPCCIECNLRRYSFIYKTIPHINKFSRINPILSKCIRSFWN